MKKVDWEYAPDWAEFAAMDHDGRWFFFSRKPEFSFKDGVWMHPSDDESCRAERVYRFADDASQFIEGRP